MLCLECDAQELEPHDCRKAAAGGGDRMMHADAGGDGEGGDEVGKLLMWLLAEMDAAARGVLTAEDLSVHELRKRARSLSLEMKGDLDSKQRTEQGSPGICLRMYAYIIRICIRTCAYTVTHCTQRVIN